MRCARTGQWNSPDYVAGLRRHAQLAIVKEPENSNIRRSKEWEQREEPENSNIRRSKEWEQRAMGNGFSIGWIEGGCGRVSDEPKLGQIDGSNREPKKFSSLASWTDGD